GPGVVDLHRDQAGLGAVRAEDVGEAGRDDGPEAEVPEGPHGVLPRGATAEVGPGDQDHRTLVLGPVEHEAGVLPPLAEEALAEARALDALEPVAGDDLVGVDV